MDYRELIEQKKVDVNQLPEKTKHRIKKFKDTLAMYNKTPHETSKANMQKSLEYLNEDIVDDIIYYLHEKEEEELNKNPTPTHGETSKTKQSETHPDTTNTKDENQDTERPKSFFHMFGW